jgi:hypothetical protein
MLLLVSALFIGVALGLRHNVFILVPASILSVGIILIVGIAGHDSVWAIVLITIAAVATLQVGYVVGTVIVPSAGGRQNVAGIAPVPVKNVHEGAGVVYLRSYWSAKIR